MPGPVGFAYNCSEVGTSLSCDPNYDLHNFDTEQELADFVDLQAGEPGYYWKCNNRIPYPPNLVEWDLGNCVDPEPEDDPQP
jgi:hypothetical protein